MRRVSTVLGMRPQPRAPSVIRARTAACKPALCLLVFTVTPVPAASQTPAELTATPEASAELFLRSVRAIRWSTAAQFMHEETLERFRSTVRMMAAADTTQKMSLYLVDTDSAGLLALDRAAVFDRSIGRVIDDLPGLMHAIFDRDDEVIGHVPEGPDQAHVVYRTTARISGAVSEVKVMQLGRTGEGWRVRWSDELEVLDAALRGMGRK